jgi:penicillin-binding protein 2
MNLKKQLDDDRVRIYLLFIVAVMVLGGLAAFMWRVQVIDQSVYSTSELRQSMRRVRIPAPRGRILDRHGNVLAANRPNYCVAIYIEELRRPGRSANTVDAVEAMVETLSEVMGLERQVSRAKIVRHMKARQPLPLLAWKDVGEAAIARWAEHPDPLPGVDIYVEPVRVYPQATLAAHLVGTVGRRPDNPEEDYNFTLPDMRGTGGAELTFNQALSGVPGGRLLQVDASGFKYRSEFEQDPVSGRDVVLTIDADIQRIAESLFLLESESKTNRGACVVLDVNSGDVLAMASAPSFNPQRIRDSRTYAALNRDPALPLWNRAISGAYPPGSTFKPVVAITALVNSDDAQDKEISCTGVFMLGNFPFKCWKKSGHGSIKMRKSIEQSCNAYYYQLGLDCGHRRIYHIAEALGFGQRTGIGIPGEAMGLLPSDRWKRDRFNNDGWRSGDTCNLSIGQGYLLATPLQMAVYTAALANGGYVMRPRITADREEGEIINDMHWPRHIKDLIHGGMKDVIHSDRGTGKRARLPDVFMAGKTGSAQYGRNYDKTHAWMIAFAPVEDPQYAVALVIEDGVSGGVTAAPRIQMLMRGIFDLDKKRARVLAGRGPV